MNKIYNVHIFNDFSGAPRVFKDAINANKSTYKNIVVTSQHSGFLTNASDSTIKIPYFRSNNKYLTLLSLCINQLCVALFLIASLIKDKLKGDKSVVFANTMLPFGAMLAGKLTATDVIVYVHETSLKPKVFKLFLRKIIKFTASKIIYVSEYLKQEENFENINSIVIYNGVSNEFKAPEYIDWEQKFKRKQVLFVGSLKEYKGIYEFIKLAELHPTLHFIGILNSSDLDFQNFLKKEIMPSNIKFFCRPEQLSTFYLNSFINLNLSKPEQWIETFGLTITEGLLFGTPAIAPNIGGPVEIINSSCGKCINVNQLQDISDFIFKISNDYDFWVNLATNAQKRAEYFSIDAFNNKITSLFKDEFSNELNKGQI
mgnify:CR=1 FL=1